MNPKEIPNKDYDLDAIFDFVSCLVLDCFVDNKKSYKDKIKFLDSPTVDKWAMAMIKSPLVQPESLKKHLKNLFLR